MFGADLTAMEVRYLMAAEWARFADDVLWRRSKLGLTMPEQDKQRLMEFMAAANVQDDLSTSRPGPEREP